MLQHLFKARNVRCFNGFAFRLHTQNFNLNEENMTINDREEVRRSHVVETLGETEIEEGQSRTKGEKE